MEGAPVPQDRETRLLYLFEAVRVPVNIAGVFTATLSEGLPINIVKSGNALAIISESGCHQLVRGTILIAACVSIKSLCSCSRCLEKDLSTTILGTAVRYPL